MKDFTEDQKAWLHGIFHQMSQKTFPGRNSIESPLQNLEDNEFQIQLFFGVRISFTANFKTTPINIIDLAINPNSGLENRDKKSIEEYVGYTYEDLKKALNSLKFVKCK